MDLAHADQIALNRIDVVDQMERKKRDVDVFPFYWLNQIEEGLK